MAQQELQIRAKKISELDNYNEYRNLSEDGEDSYVIIGYNAGGLNKQNYKMNLSTLINVISSSATINEENLLEKINEFIEEEKIVLPVIQGPQGPQGPQGDGSDIDLSTIQSQIDQLNRIVNQYHSYYAITYNLSNISSRNTNLNSIKFGDSAILYFDPNNGYKLPNMISVTGCEFSYDKSNSSITISNPTSNIVINIVGEKQNYIISYNFSHINYTIELNDKSTYQIGESIRLLLTPYDGYVLPDSINSINCGTDYRVNADGTGSLVITCTGLGNMQVSGSANNNVPYYFGFISLTDSNSDKIEVNFTTRPNDETEIIGIESVNIKSTDWLLSSLSCPFKINQTFTLQSEVKFGEETVMIVPEVFFDPITSIFNDGSNTGKFHSSTSNFVFSFDIYKLITINNINYYCVDMQNGLNGNDGSLYIIN